MLCAETNPVFDALTDLGEISLLTIVLRSLIFFSAEVRSATELLKDKGARVKTKRARRMVISFRLRMALIYPVTSYRDSSLSSSDEVTGS